MNARLQTAFIPVVLWLLVFSLYFQTRSFSFLNFDDTEYVTKNIHVSTGLSWANITWAFTSAHGSHWHPLSWISHMIDCQLFGLNPGAHHLVSVGIHATNVALVFLFLRVATGAVAMSFVAALLFGLHPLRIESVAWVAERKDVLSVFFMLLALWSYVRFVQTRAKSFYSLSVGTFLLSILAKPTGVVLPVLFLCLDFWPLRRVSKDTVRNQWRSLITDKIPFVLGALAIALTTLWAQGTGGGLKSLAEFPLHDRIPSILVGYLTYLGRLFFPSGIGIFYPFAQYQPGVAAGAACGLLFASILVWQAKKNHPYLLFGWLWFLVALLPVIGIVQIGGQAFADRWTYVPHLGLIVGVVWTINGVLGSRNSVKVGLSLLAVLGAAATTWFHLPHWRDSESIFRHTILVSPGNFMAHMNLGVALDAQGKLEEASSHYDRAVLEKPFYPDALNNLAGARARLGDLQNAEHLFRRALATNPVHVPSRYNLGLLLVQGGRISQGVVQWLLAAEVQPYYPQLQPSISRIVHRFRTEGCSPFVSSPMERSALQDGRLILERLPVSDLRSSLQPLFGCGE